MHKPTDKMLLVGCIYMMTCVILNTFWKENSFECSFFCLSFSFCVCGFVFRVLRKRAKDSEKCVKNCEKL